MLSRAARAAPTRAADRRATLTLLYRSHAITYGENLSLPSSERLAHPRLDRRQRALLLQRRPARRRAAAHADRRRLRLRPPLAPASLADAAMGSGELLWGVKTHLWFPLCLLWPLFGRVLRLA